MILQMAAGALIGLGFLLLIWVLAKPAPGVGATLARLDAGRRSQRSATTSAAGSRLEARIDGMRDGIGGRIEAEALARGINLDATRTNLAVMNRSMASHLGLKVLLALAALVWFPIVLSAVGISVVGLPAIGVIAAVVLAFMLPDMTLRREADARRADFRHVMGSFLDLVAMNLAGGRGLPEALMAASSIGDHWAMVRIRQALSNARIMGMTPWEGIADLGKELGVDELRDLASALALAGDEGAKIRTSLMARSDSMRRKELVEVEGAAGESSQTMLLAQLLMCTAFLIFLAYPAIQELGGA
ncbi:type II secretion system F family protein [Solicola gregarius]|uniref:Type II secretion system F family protein n=1 Tax=Solicola gregarius TaxID=2908642 RepID=A0AA46YLK0_9ACTN|nr:type II secretion system F family protein [Solicola gregarius]UYM04948.1 type II secretion system F family protein [Solicola gregarius]